MGNAFGLGSLSRQVSKAVLHYHVLAVVLMSKPLLRLSQSKCVTLLPSQNALVPSLPCAKRANAAPPEEPNPFSSQGMTLFFTLGVIVGSLVPLQRLHGYWLDRESRSTPIFAFVPDANHTTTLLQELGTLVRLERLADVFSEFDAASVCAPTLASEIHLELPVNFAIRCLIRHQVSLNFCMITCHEGACSLNARFCMIAYFGMRLTYQLLDPRLPIDWMNGYSHGSFLLRDVGEKH